jgi:hypothetical protein
LISKINDISDEMIDQIKQMEIDSKSNLTEKQNLIDSNRFDLKTLTEKILNWNEEMRNPNLGKSRLEQLIQESSSFLKEKESQLFVAKKKVLNQKVCYFIPNNDDINDRKIYL